MAPSRQAAYRLDGGLPRVEPDQEGLLANPLADRHAFDAQASAE
jgi:hypothetical protein